MNFKKDIEDLLELLKNNGIERGEIEKALGYSDNYIDQALSRGGTKKFLKAIENYAKGLGLQNTTSDEPFSKVEEDVVLYTKDYDRLLNQILSDRQVIIDLHKERSKQAEDLARKMEAHYEDAKKLNSRLLDIIDNSLKDITRNLKETAASLNQNNQQIAQLKNQALTVSGEHKTT
ncbi:hypothetical protein [Niastella sp. OAS944]|uniref:hypothetical protein n=1 Tax=Niastella sp. OAS944 TaxID=2664089 RepID=UPI0034697689|nr:hypothetical protein [Chitinophagaceae bacterium OAS944]